jgi:hypothetical protein
MTCTNSLPYTLGIVRSTDSRHKVVRVALINNIRRSNHVDQASSYRNAFRL